MKRMFSFVLGVLLVVIAVVYQVLRHHDPLAAWLTATPWLQYVGWAFTGAAISVGTYFLAKAFQSTPRHRAEDPQA
ncbi:hypothetical protein [Buchananella felis]|uniref:hypothetical protein n=1 Tax=Buchananella felis TaxID=3231492 RepID=UPI003527D040